jgi:crotonobetainyl-CoA:carnitine CoA-transferase CaiB-like acyl-CoA transferase
MASATPTQYSTEAGDEQFDSVETPVRLRVRTSLGAVRLGVMGTLDGIRVVEAGTMITAPLAAMMLGDQGAEVIKIEAPGFGDTMRHLGARRDGMSALWATCNRSKRSVALDLAQPEAQATALDLIATADVFIQNFRPGVADRLGIGERVAMARNPRLIYVSISGFGFVGPRMNDPAYDNVIQAVVGVASSQTDPRTGQPSLLRNLISDKITAYTVAQGVTSALFHRERTGEGQSLRVSMVDATLAFLWPDAMMNETLLDDHIGGPVIGHGYNVGETADGHVSHTALTDAHFRNLMVAIGHPELADDPRLATMMQRMKAPELYVAAVVEWRKHRSAEEVESILRSHDVPVGRVTPINEVFQHPQVIANETLMEHDHPYLGKMREPRPAMQFSATPSKMTRPAPRLGEHTDEVIGSWLN